MHQENGSTVNNSSERELSQETQKQSSPEIGKAYIPYSKKHNIQNETLASYCDYLERVVGVDPLFQIQKTKVIDDFQCTQFEIETFFISSELITIVYHKGKITGYGPQELVLFEGMISELFFSSYQQIISKLRNLNS